MRFAEKLMRFVEKQCALYNHLQPPRLELHSVRNGTICRKHYLDFSTRANSEAPLVQFVYDLCLLCNPWITRHPFERLGLILESNACMCKIFSSTC